ncbi:MAG: glycosyl hydrolase family 18 protein [Bacilli bacterium]
MPKISILAVSAALMAAGSLAVTPVHGVASQIVTAAVADPPVLRSPAARTGIRRSESPANATFAMVMNDRQAVLSSGSAVTLQAGTLWRVLAQQGAAATLATPAGTVAVPVAALKELTVTQNASPVTVNPVHGKVVLGFADAGNAHYLRNMAHDSLSIFSPLSFSITDASGNITGSISAAVVQAAHQRGISVWPMVEAGFNPARTTALLSSPAAQWQLLTAVVAHVQADRLDGVNFDFEDMIPSDAPRLTGFIQAAATILHTMGKGVSVDVTPPSADPNWGAVYERAALANAANYEIVMTYDEHYSGDPNPGSVASLPWMKQSIANTLALGVPNNKLLVGVPFYTRDWITNHGQLSSQYIPLAQGIADEQLPGAKTVWNAHDGQDTVTFSEGGATHTIWLENTTSLAERAQFVQADGLGGVAVWQIDLGDQADIAALANQL